MIWQDKGFLLSVNKYNENSSVAEFYTSEHGKSSGIIFGSSSKKIKSYLIPGNKLHINYSSKNSNSIGNFKIEIDKITTPFYLNDKIKLQAIIYILQIIKILTVENQSNVKIFRQIENFFKFLENDTWIKNFIHCELALFKALGYEINFNNYVKKKNFNGIDHYVSIYDENKIVPSFLLNNDNKKNINNDELLKSINVLGDFLNKSILQDTNISVPISRLKLVEFLSNL